MPITRVNLFEAMPGRKFYLETTTGDNSIGTVLYDGKRVKFENPRWSNDWKVSYINLHLEYYAKFYWVDKLTLDDYIRNIVVHQAAVTEEFKQVLTAALERI